MSNCECAELGSVGKAVKVTLGTVRAGRRAYAAAPPLRHANEGVAPATKRRTARALSLSARAGNCLGACHGTRDLHYCQGVVAGKFFD